MPKREQLLLGSSVAKTKALVPLCQERWRWHRLPLIVYCSFAGSRNPLLSSNQRGVRHLLRTLDVLIITLQRQDVPRSIVAHCAIIKIASPMITNLFPDQRTILLGGMGLDLFVFISYDGTVLTCVPPS